eukprot:Nk52_evm117s352 gene=Nk52_evmTU117s352
MSIVKGVVGTFMLVCLVSAIQSEAFYVPGTIRNSYKEHEVLPMKVVKVTSVKTQLPYDYYYFPFCRDKKIQSTKIKYYGENLGQVLLGDRLADAPFTLRMKEQRSCKIYCTVDSLDPKQEKFFEKAIRDQYKAHWQLDGLPVSQPLRDVQQNNTVYSLGYYIGRVKSGKALVNNFLQLTVLYNKERSKSGGMNIVGFEITARSLNSEHISGNEDCTVAKDADSGQLVSSKTPIKFGYSVIFKESNIIWTSRWNRILQSTEAQIHWFAIVNSLVIVFLLSGVVAMIIIRTLRKDIRKYNEEEVEDAIEESGWKLLHGDVFRPPERNMLLTALICSGLHLFLLTIVTVFFAMAGFLSPSRAGSLLNGAVMMYVLMGCFAGYLSGRMFRTFKGKSWTKAALSSSLLLPGVVCILAFVLNFFVWGKHSSKALPFGTVVAVIAIVLGICVPMVCIGFYFGFRKKPYEFPVRINQIPRQVPEQPWYMTRMPSMFLTGLLPFGAVFIELHYLFLALWTHQTYYMFGFLFLVYVIMIVTTCEITIVMVYFMLCLENYRWWWRSFLMAGGSALYVLLFAFFYFVNQLEISGFVPTAVYFFQTFNYVFTFWLLSGTVGFYATFFFMVKIYSAVKVD